MVTTKLNDYQFVSYLFSGNDGTEIIRVKNGKNQNLVLKMFRTDKRMEREFNKEAQILGAAQRPGCERFICRLLQVFRCKIRNVLVFDFIPKGTLRFHMDMLGIHSSEGKASTKTFPLYACKFYVCCILNALSYLHCNSICHGDVSLRNAMVDSQGYIVLIDFGRASIHYDALLTNTKEYFSDFKQMGLVIYELVTAEYMMRAELESIRVDKLSPDAYVVIEKNSTYALWNPFTTYARMLKLEKNAEMKEAQDFEELLLDYQFFKEIDMEKVKNRSYQASFLQQFEDQEISRDMKVWEKILKENI